jgi:hypothetical protein
LTSVLIQGTAITAVSRWLRVTAPHVTPPRAPIEVTRGDQLKGDLLELVVPTGSAPLAGKSWIWACPRAR